MGSGLWWWSQGHTELLEALFWLRSAPFRIAVGGQFAPLVSTGDLWRLWTSTLLHADGLHLLMNATALGVLGSLLEPLIGRLRWLSFFSMGALGGSLASHAVGVQQSDGASGGAFALLGAAVVLGWRLRDELEPEDRRLFGPILGGFLILNLVTSFALPFVDAAGHLGGLAVGIVLAATVRTDRQPHWLTSAWLGSFGAVCVWGWLV